MNTATASYVVLPLRGIALLAWTRDRPRPAVAGPPLGAGRALLLVQAVVYGLAGLLLLVARELMVDVWPWPISNGLAQFYAGPFLALAYGCWRYATRATVVEVLPLALGLLAFTVATLAVSIRHRSLFSASDLASWVWFGWFGLGVLGSAWLVVRLARPSRPSTSG